MTWREPLLWERLTSGLDCPMCIDGHLTANRHSDLVATLDASYVRLNHNQTHAGYCVVIFRRHVVELHELTDDELASFARDVARVGRAISALFSPVKIDNLMMGHICPHLHCHVYPQYFDDDPRAPFEVIEGEGRLSEIEQRARIVQLRRLLAAPLTSG